MINHIATSTVIHFSFSILHIAFRITWNRKRSSLIKLPQMSTNINVCITNKQHYIKHSALNFILSYHIHSELNARQFFHCENSFLCACVRESESRLLNSSQQQQKTVLLFYFFYLLFILFGG